MGEESRLDQFLKSLLDETLALEDQLSNPVITEKDLTAILDAELEKDEEQMDTKLIDVCVEALLMLQQGPDALKHENVIPAPVPDDLKEYLAQNKLTKAARDETAEAESQTSAPDLKSVPSKKPKTDDEKTKKRRRFRFISLVAAVITLFCALTIASFAGVSPFKISEDIVSFVDEYLKIDFGNAKTDAANYSETDNALTKELAENGFDSLILPKNLLSEDWKVEDILYDNSSATNAVNISLKCKNKNGSILISKFNNENDFLVVAERTFVDANHGTQNTFNNMDVLILQVDKYSIITYFDKNTLTCYTITVPGGQEEAMKIAESIQ